MTIRGAWKRIAGGVGVLVLVGVASVVLANLPTVSQTVAFLSQFTPAELMTLRSSFMQRRPDPLRSRLIELRMRADPGAIRRDPNPNSEIVTMAPGGTPLRAVSETRTWYLVEPHEEADGPPFRQGYVSVSDVEWVANCTLRGTLELSPGDRFQDCEASPEMVVVPAGSFVIGSPESEAYRLPDEGPQRRVEMALPFAVGAFEVTFEQWDACQRAGGCGSQHPHDLGLGRGRYPVINVNWTQARNYARWLSALTGKRYRLLSEAEWEYAARAGTLSARPGSGSESDYCEHMNGLDQTSKKLVPDVTRAVGSLLPCSDGYPASAPVGSFSPNAFGLYDMVGNVAEWTQDCYNGDYRDGPADGGARETGDCRFRVSRGGAWAYGLPNNRVASRTKRTMDSSYSSLGFRVARELD